MIVGDFAGSGAAMVLINDLSRFPSTATTTTTDAHHHPRKRISFEIGFTNFLGIKKRSFAGCVCYQVAKYLVLSGNHVTPGTVCLLFVGLLSFAYGAHRIDLVHSRRFHYSWAREDELPSV